MKMRLNLVSTERSIAVGLSLGLSTGFLTCWKGRQFASKYNNIRSSYSEHRRMYVCKSESHKAFQEHESYFTQNSKRKDMHFFLYFIFCLTKIKLIFKI